jgi:hypothetical protein
MSEYLLDSVNHGTNKLHSPIDDFFSFYFVAQWAAVFNDREFLGDSSRAIPYFLSTFRSLLAEGDSSRQSAVSKIRDSTYGEDSHGRFLAQCIPFLKEWYISLVNTNAARDNELSFTSYEDSPREKRSETYSALFKELTNQLLIDTLKIAHKHLSRLSELEAVS